MHIQHIQDDFVRRRQQDKLVTPEELIRLMKVARSAFSLISLRGVHANAWNSRLLAASWLQNEVTIDVWKQAKELDGRRERR